MKYSVDRRHVTAGLALSASPNSSLPSDGGEENRSSCASDSLVSIDSPAWLAVAERFRARVAAYIRRTTRNADEVEDLLADVWADLWCEQYVHSKRSVDETVVIVHARAACARWKAAHRYEVDTPITDWGGPPPESTEDDEQQRHRAFRRIFELAKDLPRQQFYAIVFRDLRGATFKDVAAAMGCSVSAAKTHYHRGIDTIKRILSRNAELDSV